MFRALEGYEGSVEPVRLPIGLPGAPIAAVSRDPEQDVMMPQVLRSLVGIATAGSRGSHQRQTQRTVVRLV